MGTTATTKVKRDVAFYKYLMSAGYQPADLRRYGNAVLKHNIVYKGVDMYRTRETCFDKNILQQAINFAETHFGPYMEGVGMATSSEVIQALDETKSPGYPWNLVYKNQGQFLDSEDTAYLHQHWEDLATKSAPWSIWASSIKDELRPIKKVMDHASRVIHGASIEMKVSLNRYCLKQNEAFYDSHLHTSSAVGINPYSGGWDRVYRKLSAHARGFALDESQYDTSLHAALLTGVRDLRWGWLGLPESSDHKVRFYNLYDDVIKSRLITPLGDVFAKDGGNPSGSPNTVVDNTISLYILLAYAFIQNTGGTYSDFITHVEALLYGDDNTLTVSEEMIGAFNGRSIQASFKEFGVIVKDDNLDPRPLDELDFLKKKFVDVGGTKVFCPLDPEKHLHSLLLRSKGGVVDKLGRACAVRQLVFFSNVYPIVDGWCKHLIKSYKGPQSKEWKNALAQYLSPRQVAASYMVPMESACEEAVNMAIIKKLWKGGDPLKESLLNMQQQEQPTNKRRNRARTRRRRAPASRRVTAAMVVEDFPDGVEVPIRLADFNLAAAGNSVRMISARIALSVTNDGSGACMLLVGSHVGDEITPMVIGSGPFKRIDEPLLICKLQVIGSDVDNVRTCGGTISITIEYSDRLP